MSSYSPFRTPAETRSARYQLHGVLLQVYESGVLLLGEAGVGKTACAVELVTRGHALIADDAVQIFSSGKHFVGRPPEATRSLINIRSVGIVNLLDLFNSTSVREESRIDVCIEICETELVPSNFRSHPVLSRTLTCKCIPTGTPESSADLVETIVREYATTLEPLTRSTVTR